MNQNLNRDHSGQKHPLQIEQQTLRQASKDVLKTLPSSEMLIRSKRIAQNLKGLLREKSKVCGIFHPMKLEPQVQTLRDEADLHVEFAFPYIQETDAPMQMDFYFAKKMRKSPMGFMMPDLTDEQTKKAEIDTIVVPGLVFHPSGIRIGRGGGYYDRFLSSFRGIRIGVGFEEQVLNEPWEQQSWDEKVHYVVTENRVIDCQRSGE